MIWFHHGGADVFGRACEAGVQRVHIKIAWFNHVTGNHGTLKKVNVLAIVDDAGGVVQVDQQ